MTWPSRSTSRGTAGTRTAPAQSGIVEWFDEFMSRARPMVEQKALLPTPSRSRDDYMDDGDALRVLLPVLIVLSTLLFVLLVFLVCLLFLRKRRGIALRDNDGPIDMSREELIDGEGGFDGVESRWLESVSEEVRRAYKRAKDWQIQYPPNSLPTDITLSQFLAIQEKGVSAWSFEPDYEANPNLTFLPDPSSYSTVQSNLPLPKLNEVYYWEVKMFDLPPSTTIAIGLATKPFPLFRLPGWNRHSVAYHSSGDKAYNYPFTAATYGSIAQGGRRAGRRVSPAHWYRFFHTQWSQDGGCVHWPHPLEPLPDHRCRRPLHSHVNLGQSGFVFIEANVKKWGLAPSVGTLAPPPAYGAERGSILLQSGGDARAPTNTQMHTIPASPPRRSHRLRRPKTVVARDMPNPSAGLLHPPSPVAQQTPPPQALPLAPVSEFGPGPSTSHSLGQRYLAPTDRTYHHTFRASSTDSGSSASSTDDTSGSGSSGGSHTPTGRSPASRRGAEHLQIQIQVDPPPSNSAPGPDTESPVSANPPTPNLLDIDLRVMAPSSASPPRAPTSSSVPHQRTPTPAQAARREGSDDLAPPTPNAQAPPAYSPLDAFTYADGVQIDLPAEVIAAALEGRASPVPNHPQSHRSGRRAGGGRR
ncbi:SPRY-domain-containing protein [Auriculariales sp. MPI-PUGE-AT-0066]|nr:SPRY-domain-containing protein [Auriculariales sp. MPI-PUGE-AT-0066]